MSLTYALEALSRNTRLKINASLAAWLTIAPAGALALTLGGDPVIILSLLMLSVPAAMVFVSYRWTKRKGIRRHKGLAAAYYRAKQRAALDKTIDLVAFDIRRAVNEKYAREFLAKYFSTLVQYVRLAKKDIVVLDYLAHHRSFDRIHWNEFVRSYEGYFRAIEERVASRNIPYTRILQLPLGEDGELNRKALVARCVELMFVQTLEHIKRMYENACDFQLYILEVPLRPYSYMIIDEKFLLSEYDRYNRSATSLPDHLIVDRADSGNSRQDDNVRTLIEHHLQQLEAVVSTKEPVTSEEIQEAVLRMEFNEWDPENLARTPEEREERRRDIEMKQAVYSPNPGPEADT